MGAYAMDLNPTGGAMGEDDELSRYLEGSPLGRKKQIRFPSTGQDPFTPSGAGAQADNPLGQYAHTEDGGGEYEGAASGGEGSGGGGSVLDPSGASHASKPDYGPYSDDMVREVQNRVAAGPPQFQRPGKVGWKKGLGLVAAGFAAGPRGGAQIADEAFNRPWQRANADFTRQQGQYNEDVRTMHDIGTEATNNAHWAEMGPLRKAQADYFSRRPPAGGMQGLHEQYVSEDIQAGKDPSQDPRVLQVEDAIGRTQRDPAEKNPNPYADYASGDPTKQKRATGWIRAGADARNESRNDNKPAPAATPAQSANVEARKTSGLTSAQRDFDEGKIDQDALLDRRQQVEDGYEAEVTALGGSARHQDVRTDPGWNGGQQPVVQGPGSAVNRQGPVANKQVKPTGKPGAPNDGDVKYYGGKPYKFNGKTRQWEIGEPAAKPTV